MKSPKFILGFELEGVLRDERHWEFDAGLRSISSDINRGTDGSVDGHFQTRRYHPSYGYTYEGDDGDGIEIRTPPLPEKESLTLFYEILKYLELWTTRKDFKTNTSCGLHVSLSEKSMVQKFLTFQKFYSHLVCRFPEEKVLKMFRRTGNEYCYPLFTRKADKKFDAVLQRVQMMHLGCGKYHTAAFHGYSDDYPDNIANRRIEFRCLGNKDYHRKVEKLQTALGIITECATEAFHSVIGSEEGIQREPQFVRAA